ncbi:MAG: magnesium transporter [Myxococcales bacterium]|nr:magnesium transporter [Myxococcales bacterium]
MQVSELLDKWPDCDCDSRYAGFLALSREDAETFFGLLPAHDAAEFLLELPIVERKTWMRLLPPDDAADLLQEVNVDQRVGLLNLLDEVNRKEVAVLLAYAEDDAGGLMSTRFARVRPDLRVDEALLYLRRQAREHLETIYYVYVLDQEQHLQGIVSLRQLFQAPVGATVRDVMQTTVQTVPEDMDQEELSRKFRQYGYLAIPVVDGERRIKGIVTLDDIVDVVDEEATEDAQKFGGMEALDSQYLEASFFEMFKKRAGWLAVLFLGEMLTASAMGHFQDEIAKAVVLTLFVPLIISSGGNSGSQASTLVIRAMALGELRLRDAYRVARRELAAGLALGSMLAILGILRVVLADTFFGGYGDHALRIGLAVGISLVGVVVFGTLAGSMLPLLLHRAGFDPASASAPFVATLVDVSGLIIYFSVATLLLSGTLL